LSKVLNIIKKFSRLKTYWLFEFYRLAKGGRYDGLVDSFSKVISGPNHRSARNRVQKQYAVTGGVIFVNDAGTTVGKESYSRHDHEIVLF